MKPHLAALFVAFLAGVCHAEDLIIDNFAFPVSGHSVTSISGEFVSDVQVNVDESGVAAASRTISVAADNGVPGTILGGGISVNSLGNQQLDFLGVAATQPVTARVDWSFPNPIDLTSGSAVVIDFANLPSLVGFTVRFEDDSLGSAEFQFTRFLFGSGPFDVPLDYVLFETSGGFDFDNVNRMSLTMRSGRTALDPLQNLVVNEVLILGGEGITLIPGPPAAAMLVMLAGYQLRRFRANPR